MGSYRGDWPGQWSVVECALVTACPAITSNNGTLHNNFISNIMIQVLVLVIWFNVGFTDCGTNFFFSFVSHSPFRNAIQVPTRMHETEKILYQMRIAAE